MSQQNEIKTKITYRQRHQLSFSALFELFANLGPQEHFLVSHSPVLRVQIHVREDGSSTFPPVGRIRLGRGHQAVTVTELFRGAANRVTQLANVHDLCGCLNRNSERKKGGSGEGGGRRPLSSPSSEAVAAQMVHRTYPRPLGC